MTFSCAAKSRSVESAGDYRNGADIESDNFNPAIAYGYRNGGDVESDLAYEARRSEEWIEQNDDIIFRRGGEIAKANSVTLPDGSVDHPGTVCLAEAVGVARGRALGWDQGGGVRSA